MKRQKARIRAHCINVYERTRMSKHQAVVFRLGCVSVHWLACPLIETIY